MHILHTNEVIFSKNYCDFFYLGVFRKIGAFGKNFFSKLFRANHCSILLLHRDGVYLSNNTYALYTRNNFPEHISIFDTEFLLESFI